MFLSTVQETWRFDAEYWHPVHLENKRLIARAGERHEVKSVYDLVRQVTGSAFYPSFVGYYGDVGMPFIRVADLGEFFVKDEGLVRIDPHIIRQYRQVSTIHEGDIVIAKGGSIGGVCIVQPGFGECAVCRDVIALQTDSKKVNSLYLVAFLRSQFGQLQLDRYKSQQVQAHLTFPAVGNIEVVVPSPEFQSAVADQIRRSIAERKRSQTLYAEAETLLLAELGLDRLDLSHQVTYTAQFSGAWAAGRLDAEHFQPKYYRVLDALHDLTPTQMLCLGDMVTTITNGHTPLRHDLRLGEVPFITAEFVADFRVDYGTDKRVFRKHHEADLQRTALRENDLLITIKGRVGNAAVVSHLPGDFNINQDVALLRLKPEFHPYYVAAFLNSDAGKALTDQICTGQINPFLGLGNLKQVAIPIFEPKRMNEIGDRVQSIVEAAYAAYQGSQRLLDDAKQRVEEMVLGT